MSTVWLVLSFLLVAIGLIGCFLPIIPGPIVAYCGLLCTLPTPHPPSVAVLVLFGCVIICVTILDYVVPAVGAKKFNCSRLGTLGCVLGTIVGVFFFPIGLIAGPFLGAFIGELLARKHIGAAAMGGLGALLGFLTGVVIKVIACSAILLWLILNI